MRYCVLILLSCMCFLLSAQEAAIPLGTEGLISIECADKEVRIFYQEEHPAVNLRILQQRSVGDKRVVDIAWIANRSGTYLISDFLRYSDGTAVSSDQQLHAIESVGILPADHDGSLVAHKDALEKPWLSYASFLNIIIALWLACFVAIFWFTRNKQKTADNTEQIAEPTLADHLRGLISKAQSQTLNNDEQAYVERLIYTYWQQKLGLEQHSIQESLQQMRADAEAGPAIRLLDQLFHIKPDDKNSIAIESVLAPYQQVRFAGDQQ